MRLHLLLKLACLGVALGLAACSGLPPQPVSSANQSRALLQSYVWHPVVAVRADGTHDPLWDASGAVAPTLRFDNFRLTLDGVCQPITTQYGSSDRRLEVTPPSLDTSSCGSPAEAELSRTLAARLSQLEHYQLYEHGKPRLALTFADASRWELTGEVSPQTRFKSPTDDVILEVAPQLMPCRYGLMAPAQCLAVRQMRRDAQGRLGLEESWQPFFGTIQDYEHEAGLSSVLRIRRFRLQNPPTHHPTYYYILDEVIASSPQDRPEEGAAD